MKIFDKILTKDFLYKEYIINKKSSVTIAEQVGCSKKTISLYLKKYEIRIRNKSKAAYLKFKYKGNSNLGRRKTNPITPINMLIRKMEEYNNWRKGIYKRDNYTCQKCGDRTSGNLNAHHKKQFAIILSEFLKEYDQFSPIEDKETLVRLATKYKPFWDLNNGQSLCKDCHKEIKYIRSNYA